MGCLFENESVPVQYGDPMAIVVADLEAAQVAVLAFPSAATVVAPVAASAAETRRLTHGLYKHPREFAATIVAQDRQEGSTASKIGRSSFEPSSHLRKTKPLCGSSGLAMSGLARNPEDPD